jgi:hypothetical protein
MAKKKTKKGIAYTLLVLSTFFLIFNNIGQFLTFVDIPFTRTTQMWMGILGILISIVWYSYLEGAIR